MDPLVRRSLQTAVSGAEVVLCYSERFRDFLLAFNSRVAVVPAAFEFSLIDDAPAPAPHGELRIGVVANISRAADIAVLVPVVEQVLSRGLPGVVFEFFGYTPPELEGRAGVRSLPGVANYKTYLAAKLARGWLLGLAPLNGGRFAEYKTNNKLREFGACGIAAIYSDTRIYRECVEPGRTGWLVPNDPDQWTAAILAALADPAGTRQVGQQARDYVRSHHHMSSVAQAWKAAIAPAVAAIQRDRDAIRAARKQVIAWNRGPARAPQTFTAGGTLSKPLPGEAAGHYYRDVLLLVNPEETIECEVPAPVAGRYRWTAVIATYREVLHGVLVVEVVDASGTLQRTELDLVTLPDNVGFKIDCDVRAAGSVRILVTNEGTGRLALYGLSQLGRTVFPATGLVAPFGFAV
jgi:hypothetical protein